MLWIHHHVQVAVQTTSGAFAGVTEVESDRMYLWFVSQSASQGRGDVDLFSRDIT